MKTGDKIKPIHGDGESGRILIAPKPPNKWLIEFESGKRKLYTKSKIKKYFELII